MPGPHQHLVVGRVANEVQPVVLLGDLFEPGLVPVDDDERSLPLRQVLADGHAHPAHAADDEVVFEGPDLSFHASPLQHPSDFRIDDELPDLEGAVRKDTQPADQVHDDKEHGPRIATGHVFGTECRQRNDGQVERLQPGPPGQQLNTGRSGRGQRQQQSCDGEESSHSGRCAPDAPFVFSPSNHCDKRLHGRSSHSICRGWPRRPRTFSAAR